VNLYRSVSSSDVMIIRRMGGNQESGIRYQQKRAHPGALLIPDARSLIPVR
jgi:hypothetical protein